MNRRSDEATVLSHCAGNSRRRRTWNVVRSEPAGGNRPSPRHQSDGLPRSDQILLYFYWGANDFPGYRGGNWCGAAQGFVWYHNLTGALQPCALEECHAGQYWRYSSACNSPGSCDENGRYQSPPMRGISMVCLVPNPPPPEIPGPDNPPLGCITGSGGFSRCLHDGGVLPSTTPAATPRAPA